MKNFTQKTKSLRLLALMCVLSLCVGAWGQSATATLSFTKACGGSGTDDKANSWTITSDAAESNFDSTKGIHYGTGSKAVSYLTITSSAFTKNISKIVVYASDANSSAKIDVTVGGITFGTQSSALTSSNTAYTFEPTTAQQSTNFTGAVVVKISRSSAKKALYCKSIEVTYVDGNTPSCSVSPTSIDFGKVETGASVAAQDVTVTLTNTTSAAATLSGTNADAFEITAGEELSASGTVTVQPKAATLSTVGTYTASLDIEAEGVEVTKSVAISLQVTEPAKKYDVTHDFTDIEGFSSWGSTYKEHVVSYTNDKVIFASANCSGSTITDCPVTKGGDVELILTDSKKTITAVRFECKQWGSKAQKITLHYSTDGGSTYSTLDPSVTSDDFTIESTSLPKNTDAVKITFSTTSNQVGISSVSYDMGNKELTSSAITFTAPANGSLTVKDGENTITSGTLVQQYSTVTLNVVPEDGYKLGTLTVTDADESTVELTKVDETNYTFEMPEKAVSVAASYVVAKVLQSVAITKSATKTMFWKGETFSSAGLELTATFTTGEEVVTPTSYSGYDMNTVGEQTVTVSFTEGTVTKTANYTINVKSIANTAETAYTTAEAIEIIDANPSELSSTEVYVKGTISKIDSFNETYKSITYWLDDNAFEVYSGKGLEGADFTAITDLNVEDEVVVKGKIKKYGSTYELDKENVLVSRKVSEKKTPTLTATYNTELLAGSEAEVFTVEYDGDGSLSVSSTDETVATAEIKGNEVTVTPLTKGSTTITISASSTEEYAAASISYTLKVVQYASIPFAFDGGKSNLTDGMSQSGLGDYSSSPKLKFDSTGDNLIIHYSSEANYLSYYIKDNSFSGGTFDVLESADGESYSTVSSYTSITNGQKVKRLNTESRFVKFVYTNKSSGNVALGTIKIENKIAEDAVMTISAANKWATFYAPFAVDVPANVYSYAVTVDGTNAVRTKIGGDEAYTLPAETAVLVYTDNEGGFSKGFFEGEAEGVAGKAPEGNMLVGTAEALSEIPSATGYTNYILQMNTGTIGWYQTVNGNTLPANRAYLSVPDGTSVKGIFDFTTGINEVRETISSEGMYNMAGQKVGADYKGIVIVNGKKMLNK